MTKIINTSKRTTSRAIEKKDTFQFAYQLSASFLESFEFELVRNAIVFNYTNLILILMLNVFDVILILLYQRFNGPQVQRSSGTFYEVTYEVPHTAAWAT